MTLIPANNKYRQALLSWHGRKAAFREHWPDLYERVGKLLRSEAATEADYRAMYEEVEGLAAPKPRPPSGGRPAQYAEAVGAVKVLLAMGLSWRQVWVQCRKAGVQVQDDFGTFRRSMQRKLGG